jgi:hypothetical protein
LLDQALASGSSLTTGMALAMRQQRSQWGVGVDLTDSYEHPIFLAGSPSKASVAEAYARRGSIGAHLGHDPGDSTGQPRSPTDSSAWSLTCANALDLHLVRDHTVYGMQGVTDAGDHALERHGTL